MGSGHTRRNFIKWFIRGCFVSAISYPFFFEPNLIALKKVEVPVKGLPKNLDSLKIGLLADFHRGIYTSSNDIRRAAKIIQGEKPDILLLAGDFVEGKAEYIHSVALILSKIITPLGKFAVLGNHDYWTDAKLISEVLEKNNIQVLINKTIEIKKNNESFFLLGLDDAWAGKPDYKKPLKNIPKEKLIISLVHEPDYADLIKCSDRWIPLQLSGHSHGGQVVLPFFGAPVLPYMGKKYSSGLNRVGKSNRFVYTTKGIGTIFPLRFNCRPEATILTLKAEDNTTT